MTTAYEEYVIYVSIYWDIVIFYNLDIPVYHTMVENLCTLDKDLICANC